MGSRFPGGAGAVPAVPERVSRMETSRRRRVEAHTNPPGPFSTCFTRLTLFALVSFPPDTFCRKSWTRLRNRKEKNREESQRILFFLFPSLPSQPGCNTSTEGSFPLLLPGASEGWVRQRGLGAGDSESHGVFPSCFFP